MLVLPKQIEIFYLSFVRRSARQRNDDRRRSGTNSRRNERLEERCKKCEDSSFARKKVTFCSKVCSSENQQKNVCKSCKASRYRKQNPDKCSNCIQTTTTTTTSTTTTTTTTTTLSPERSLMEQKRKCKEERSRSPKCAKILDKCNSRVFRTTHSGSGRISGLKFFTRMMKQIKFKIF